MKMETLDLTNLLKKLLNKFEENAFNLGVPNPYNAS